MRLSYSSATTLGHRQRYCTVHHFFFFAAFLDPRVKNRLPTMLHPTQYDKLLSDIETTLISDAMKRADCNTDTVDGDGPRQEDSNISPAAQRMSSMFDGIKTLAQSTSTIRDVQDKKEVLREECREEMRQFKKVFVDLPLYDRMGQLTNPLQWWKSNCSSYPNLSMMARQYLAIPATSAPSERVWSRASNILNSRRANLTEEVLQRMMFVKENTRLLRKHYRELRLNDPDAEKFPHLVDEEMKFLPDVLVEEGNMDIGQDD